MRARSGPYVAFTHNALRMVAGLLFWQHGVQKLLGGLGAEGSVELFSIMGLAGVLEFFGGLLILFGLFTRPVAFVLAGEMAVAYFYQHFPNAFWPIQNRGELAALYCFIFLFLLAAGPGRFSVDGWLKRRRSTGGVGAAPGGRSGAPPGAGAGGAEAGGAGAGEGSAER